jgi:hypothetical protein
MAHKDKKKKKAKSDEATLVNGKALVNGKDHSNGKGQANGKDHAPLAAHGVKTATTKRNSAACRSSWSSCRSGFVTSA